MQKTVTALVGMALMASALPVSAQTGSTTATTTPPANTGHLCVQRAVEVRETALITAWGAHSTRITTALQARKTALVSAWGLSDSKARREARRKGWDAWQVASKASHTTMRTDRKATWDAFKTASKACKVDVVESASSDSHGNVGL